MADNGDWDRLSDEEWEAVRLAHGEKLATALFGLSREQDVAMALWRTLNQGED